jgi:RNA polymerase sigma-70 factor, ECF subfamily
MEQSSEKIWQQFEPELKRFALSKLKDKDTRDDILQEVFIKLHTQKETIQDPSRIKQWLYQVTRNTITDHFRKRKENMDIRKYDIPEQPEEKTYNGEFSKCLPALIAKLPEKYKEAVTLVELNRFSQLQLAEKLKISYSGAKSRVQRGRDLLKRYFENCCKTSTDKYGNILSYLPRAKCACGLH